MPDESSTTVARIGVDGYTMNCNELWPPLELRTELEFLRFLRHFVRSSFESTLTYSYSKLARLSYTKKDLSPTSANRVSFHERSSGLSFRRRLFPSPPSHLDRPTALGQ